MEIKSKNLEVFLDKELRKDTMEVLILNKDGSNHNDVDYMSYKVLEVSYNNKTASIYVDIIS